MEFLFTIAHVEDFGSNECQDIKSILNTCYAPTTVRESHIAAFSVAKR